MPDTSAVAARHASQRNLLRFLAVAGVLYVCLYGSDIAITARPDTFLGLRPPGATSDGDPGHPWAYVPVSARSTQKRTASEQGVPVFESHLNNPNLAANDLYQRLQAARKSLRISAEGTIKDGRACVPLRKLVPWVGDEMQWDGAGKATIFSTDGITVFTPGQTRAERNYSPVDLPAPPYVDGKEFCIPLLSAAKAFNMSLERETKTGIYVLQKGTTSIRVLMPVRALHIEIDRSDRWLQICYAGTLVKHYQACTGAGNNTPVGEFEIQNKAAWPGWRAYWGEYIPGGSPRNPLGARWLGTTARGHATSRIIGIHGTNQPSSIGQRISGGCVRLLNKHALELYEVIPVGTRVSIHE
ncbi:L,D-transpeptidase [bacterium]|nr:L,D-transpeptidase [bacterium]